jgi:hypothetical protein
LHYAAGASLAASDVWAPYEAWCAGHDLTPLSRQRLGGELRGLGLTKRKSCGLIRYRDVQLVA